MFGGESLTTIDGKGRTSIPVRFREMLEQCFADSRVVITKASPVDFGDGTYGRGLSVYPLSEWKELEKKIQENQGGLSLAQLNSLKRLIIGPAQECLADKLGRVLIPPTLRSHAELERELYFVGMGQRFDIWGKDTYHRVNAQDEKNFPQNSPAVAELGL